MARRSTSVAYVTLDETIEAEARRHEARAAYHAANGRPDYAAGSMRKAHRKRVQAEKFRASRDCGPLLNAVLDTLANKILGEILDGP